jgi:hypothetical protein
MHCRATWDDDTQQVVRWEFDGIIGRVNFIHAANETAGMALLSPAEQAHTLVNIRWWQFPFPDRPFEYLGQMIQANMSYGLGDVVIVVPNPITRQIIQRKLTGIDYKIAPSLEAGRAMLQPA